MTWFKENWFKAGILVVGLLFVATYFLLGLQGIRTERLEMERRIFNAAIGFCDKLSWTDKEECFKRYKDHRYPFNRSLEEIFGAQ